MIKGNIYKKYINKNQSLKYQIMVILMEEHKKARLGNGNKGLYLGDNRLIFDADHWLKMKKEINKIISETYKEIFLDMSDNQILQIMENNDLFTFEIIEYVKDKPTIIFKMLDNGYSYQYNGYKKGSEKLQKTANGILLATLAYYILSLLLDHHDKLVELFKWILGIFKNINIQLEIMPTIIMVLFIVIIPIIVFLKKFNYLN
ncbi:MAG: hypothetical protein ACRC4T_08240 [Cetobacterium sp.]